MIDFELIQMLVVNARRTSNGNRTLARFDVRVAGVVISGCPLIERESGEIVAHGITGKAHHGHDVRVRFEDQDLANKIAAQAFEVFERLSGRPTRV